MGGDDYGPVHGNVFTDDAERIARDAASRVRSEMQSKLEKLSGATLTGLKALESRIAALEKVGRRPGPKDNPGAAPSGLGNIEDLMRGILGR